MPVWTAWTMSGRIGACTACQFTVQQLNSKYSQCVGLQSPLYPSDFAVRVCVASEPCRRNLLPISNCEKRHKTDLEDIGDGDGVLGGLALGGDDGDGRP
jgi:hypothetical protein